MSTNVSGADLEALGNLAILIDRGSAQLVALNNTTTSAVMAMDHLWEGRDSAEFKQQWMSIHQPKIGIAARELNDAAATIRRNRQAQEVTSAADLDGTSGSWLSPLATGLLDYNPALAFTNNPIIDNVWDFVAGDVGNFWSGGDDNFPFGQLAAAGIKSKRIIDGGFQVRPLFNTGFVGQKFSSLLQRGPGALSSAGAWMNTPGADLFFKRAGIVGGVAGTGIGLYEIYNEYGLNPIDGFQQGGAGYVADVASTAFSASSTAFLVAPNPVTGAIVLTTGAVWLGAEVVDNWDDISEWTSETWSDVTDWSSDTWDAGAGLVTSGVGEAVEFVDDVGDAASNFVGDVAGGAGDLAGSVVSSVRDWF